MAEQQPVLTRHDLEAKLVKRCWENEEFRQEFISDPAAAFAKYLEVPQAGLPKIVVHQEEAGSWHIVLPAKPVTTGELSDQDLERVSGGTTPACVISAVTVTIATVVTPPLTYVTYTISRDEGGW